MIEHLVYLPAYATQDLARAKALATAMGVALIDAKMILAARSPRRVGAFARREDAEAMIRALGEAGLRGFLLDRREFAANAFVVRAKGLERRGDALAFRPIEILGPAPEISTNEMVLPRDAVKLIVLGQFVQNKVRAVAREDGVYGQFTSIGEGFLHLYWGSTSGYLELRHTTFDYSCLPEKAISGTANFSGVSDGIRRFYSGAAFDDVLLRQPGDSEIMTASIPVDWNVGTTFLGAVSYSKSASNEPVAMCASRIIAKSLL